MYVSFKFVNFILNSCSFASLPIGSSSRMGQNVRERDKMFANGTKCSRTGSVRAWDGTYFEMVDMFVLRVFLSPRSLELYKS